MSLENNVAGEKVIHIEYSGWLSPKVWNLQRVKLIRIESRGLLLFLTDLILAGMSLLLRVHEHTASHFETNICLPSF